MERPIGFVLCLALALLVAISTCTSQLKKVSAQQPTQSPTTTPVPCEQDDHEGVYFYDQIGYKGNCLFKSGVAFVANSESTVLHGYVRSIRIVPGTEQFIVFLFQFLNFAGSREAVEVSTSDLTLGPLAGKYGSFMVAIEAPPPSPPPFTIPVPMWRVYLPIAELPELEARPTDPDHPPTIMVATVTATDTILTPSDATATP